MQRRPVQHSPVETQLEPEPPQTGAPHWPPSHGAPWQQSAALPQLPPWPTHAAQVEPRHSLPAQQGVTDEQLAPAVRQVEHAPWLHSPSQHRDETLHGEPARRQLVTHLPPVQS